MRSAGPFFVVKFRRQVATGPGAGTVAHWSLMLCATALGIILGETYQKPQVVIRPCGPDVNSHKRQATSGKQQAA